MQLGILQKKKEERKKKKLTTRRELIIAEKFPICRHKKVRAGRPPRGHPIVRFISDSYQYTSLDCHKIEIPTAANQHGAQSATVSSGRRKNLFPIKIDFWGKKNEWISKKKKNTNI